jgi:DNA-directed RNA polymerase subunit M/transcription elongation factor TFIIS
MSKTEQIQCVLLTQKAEIKQVKLSLSNGTLSMDTIKQFMKKKETPQLLGKYPFKNQILTLFGFSTGKAGSENKHELPPPLDAQLYFGDILVIASKNTDDYREPVSLTTAMYETFYTAAFGGFEDLEEDEEEEENEIQEENELDDEELPEEEEIEIEDEEEEEEIQEEEVEGDEEEEERPQPRIKKAPKKKKTAQSTLSNNIAHVLMNIPLEEHLQEDTSLKMPLDSHRTQAIGLLDSLLKEYSVKGLSSIQLESVVYNSTIQDAKKKHITPHWKCDVFDYMYTMKLRTLMGNLLPGSYVQNTYLLSEIQEKNISIQSLLGLNPYQMNNSLWKDYIHRRQQREKRQLEGNKAMATDQFLCTRCHKRECTYYEMQTRSADEPMTIFITCMNCGKHWRQ